MKTLLKLMLAAAALLSGIPVVAQTTVQAAPGSVTALPQIAAVGVQTTTVQMLPWTPSSFAVNWVATGTKATACTFYPVASSDNINWDILASSDTTGATMTPFDCSSPGRFAIAFKPSAYFALMIVTYTPGDGTTRVFPFLTTAGGK